MATSRASASAPVPLMDLSPEECSQRCEEMKTAFWMCPPEQDSEEFYGYHHIGYRKKGGIGEEDVVVPAPLFDSDIMLSELDLMPDMILNSYQKYSPDCVYMGTENNFNIPQVITPLGYTSTNVWLCWMLMNSIINA